LNPEQIDERIDETFNLNEIFLGSTDYVNLSQFAHLDDFIE
jgi:hypothetical protein